MSAYDKAATWIRENPKTSGALGIIGTLGVAAGSYYGVPPSVSQPVLKAVCVFANLCPAL